MCMCVRLKYLQQNKLCSHIKDKSRYSKKDVSSVVFCTRRLLQSVLYTCVSTCIIYSQDSQGPSGNIGRTPETPVLNGFSEFTTEPHIRGLPGVIGCPQIRRPAALRSLRGEGRCRAVCPASPHTVQSTDQDFTIILAV